MRASGAHGLALVVGLLLASVGGARSAEATLDLEAWSQWRPRIRELVARQTSADGSVRYLLLVLDGDNYVVKTAPSEKLLRERVVTPEIFAVGRCEDELWAVGGKAPGMRGLRFVRDQDLNSTNVNFFGYAQSLTYGTTSSVFPFLYFGVPTFLFDPAGRHERLRLIQDGFELQGHARGRQLTNRVVLESVEHRDGRLHCRLARTLTGTPADQSQRAGPRLSGPINSRTVTDAEFEPGSFLPSKYTSYSLRGPQPRLLLTVERLSPELSDSPLPLRLFRPEPYVLEGFPMTMRLEGDKVVAVPTHEQAWRKVVLFGHVFSYRVVKWGVISLIAALTVVAVVVVRNHHRKHRKEKLS